jgi:glutamine synthetase
MHLHLDRQTFFVHPKIKNQPKTARIFAYIYQEENNPYLADPRYLLQQAIEYAARYNYTFYVGPEIEFFLVEKNNNGEIIPWDSGYYFGAETQQKHEAIKFEIMQTLLDHGIGIEKLHHEVAPGQHEISIHYDTALTIADQIMLTKHLIKQVAYQHGIYATFMPKPFFGMNGSGMHIHFSLADATRNFNLFFDEDDTAHLSSLAHRFIAGILRRMQDGALIFNSTINSFKRLVPGYEAPVYISWAKENRSTLIRIPQINDDQPYAARAELRSADALCNPYLAFTFLLQAGLAGIMHDELITPAIEENLFKLSTDEIEQRNIQTLPTSLLQALYNFENSSFMIDIFNHTLINELVKIKQTEALQFQRIVTNWELQRYL